jgi:chorismate synthase
MDYRTAGESHGRALMTIVSGVPAGLALTQDDFDLQLSRRQLGYGRGGRMSIESDRAAVLAGIRHGRTTGAPVGVTVANRDWDSWTDVMSVFGEAPERGRVSAPRPGHADLAGAQKTGTRDVRDVLERASARETAARVVAGVVARALLTHLGVGVRSWVERIGDVKTGPFDCDSADQEAVEASDVRCPDEAAASAMRRAIDRARSAGESLGGTFVVVAEGAVPGLGGYSEARERLDGRIAAALMSIPAIKGVEIGEGFAAAALPGSQVHDAIIRTPDARLRRLTNRAGGIEGGMTNGEPVVIRGAMKPIPTLMKPLGTIDLETGEAADAACERSDVCAVPAAAIVAESELAVVLADAYCRKFGADCVDDMVGALESYRRRIGI